jgi:hypothetical protein
MQVPDWRGGSEAELRRVLTGVAGMHAGWWGRTVSDEGERDRLSLAPHPGRAQPPRPGQGPTPFCLPQCMH